jgi:beta-glucanase (GH16 family)
MVSKKRGRRGKAKGLPRLGRTRANFPTLLGFLVVAVGIFVISRSQASGGPVGIPGNWNLQFDDEFSGSTLDTSKWSTGWQGAGTTGPVNPSELDCMSPNQVSVTGGELTLNAVSSIIFCGNKVEPYASGMVTTTGKYQFTYGAVEARIWMPGSGSTIDDWPSFWTAGQSEPAAGQIDIVEGLAGQACAHYHVSAYPSGLGTCVAGSFTGGWHTYAVDWEPGSLVYYYDGKVIWTDTTSIAGAPQYLALDMAMPGTNYRAPASMRVDYVRVWSYSPAGTPAPTAQPAPTATADPGPVDSSSPDPDPSATDNTDSGASSSDFPTDSPGADFSSSDLGASPDPGSTVIDPSPDGAQSSKASSRAITQLPTPQQGAVSATVRAVHGLVKLPVGIGDKNVVILVDGGAIGASPEIDTRYLANGRHTLGFTATLGGRHVSLSIPVMVDNNLSGYETVRDVLFAGFHGNSSAVNAASWIGLVLMVLSAASVLLRRRLFTFLARQFRRSASTL